MSWLSTLWDNNKNSLPQIAGGALGFAFGGPWGASLGSSLGRATMPGATLGSVAGAGLSGYGAGSLAGLAGGFVPGSAGSALSRMGAKSLSDIPGIGSSMGGALGKAKTTLMGQTIPGSTSGGFASNGEPLGEVVGATRERGLLGRAGSFAKENGNMLAGAVSGLGSMGAREAEADQMKLRTQIEKQRWEAEQRRMQALQPLLDALLGRSMGQAPQTVAPNPYQPSSFPR